MSSLRKNVASQVLNFGLVNATTGAALTGATASGKISGDGTQASATGTFTELGSGQYKYVPTQAETNVTSFGLLITATSAVPVHLQLFTVGYDPAVANLPSNVIQVNGTSQTARDLGASVLLSSGTGTGQVSLSSGTVTTGTNNDKTGYALTQTFPTNFSSLGISVGGHVSNVDTLTTYTGNTIQTGDAYARLGTPAGVSTAADIAAVNAKTTNLPASPSAVGSAMTLTSGERNSVADALLDRDMSTGADNGSTTVRTVRQALRFLRNKWAIATGTLSVYKEDDATPSWTATVTTDSNANPIVSNDPAGP